MSTSRPQTIPQTPGVYIFRKGRTPVYVGKAANLKKRLVSYFKKNAGDKVARLTAEADTVEWIETPSEIEALIQESELIKQHVPKYNVIMRDDKNFFFVGITQGDFPRIFLTHQPYTRKTVRKKRRSLRPTTYKLQASFIGPFTSGSALKEALRILRSIFPYCTCKEGHKRPCLNAEIGRCLGFCCLKAGGKTPSEEKEEYRKNIKSIVSVLNGRKKSLLTELRREMRDAVKKENFEKAAKRRDQIAGLENILTHAKVMNHASSWRTRTSKQGIYNWGKIQKNLETLVGARITRTEGYDISNISGTEATGSMVVFAGGRPDRAEYRMFGIKTVHQPNDIEMHKEVMKRRLNHPEWKFPDLMVIDGGKAQLNAALSVVRPVNTEIKVVSLAKREEELYIEKRSTPIRLATLPPETAFFFQRVRDESHRFAKKYHHKKREIFYRGG